MHVKTQKDTTLIDTTAQTCMSQHIKAQHRHTQQQILACHNTERQDTDRHNPTDLHVIKQKDTTLIDTTAQPCIPQHRKTQHRWKQQHRLISHNTDKHNSTDLRVTTQVDTTQVRHNSTDFHVTTQKDTTQIDTIAQTYMSQHRQSHH